MLAWMPNLDQEKPLRVLCLGAHSDDIEIGCGASILQLAASGRPVKICWVVFSGTEARMVEAKASAESMLDNLSQKTIVMHGYRDGDFPAEWNSIKTEFMQLRSSFEPDLVFTHYRHDRHQDHRVVGDLTWNMYRDHVILEYEIPKFDGDLDTPNFYMPVSPSAASRKVSLLMQHFQSQKEKQWFNEELFFGVMRIRGMECRSPSGYAEAFHARKTCAVL